MTQNIVDSLFVPHGGGSFHSSHWPDRHCFAHGSVERLPPILRCRELRSLDALAQRYAGPIAFGRGSVDARTITAETHAGNLLKLGFTVYLSDIASLLPGGKAWLASVEQELGVAPGCSKIGAFASPAGDGLPCHFDAEDVISVQLSGSKTFDVARVADLPYPVGQQFGPNMLPTDELYPQASDGFPKPDGLDFEHIVMEPGSVLFLPRGTWHASRANSDSFSISIGMRAPAGLDYLLHQLRSLLLQDPGWRRPLYGAGNNDSRRDAELRRLDSLLQTLPSVVGQLTAADLAPAPTGDVSLHPERGRFQKIPMSAIRVIREEEHLQLTVTAWDRDWIERTTLQTAVPVHLERALRWLAEREAAFGVLEFRQACHSVPSTDALQLLELLTKSRFLRRLSFPALSRRPSAAV